MKTKELVTLSLLTALLFAAQVTMAFLPNVELVSLLIILYAINYGKKVFFIIYGFVLLEGLFYGFGIWWFSYLYIWSILAAVTLLMRKQNSVFFWSIVSGAYGLSYGFLCAIPYFVAGGVKTGWGYWIAGIPFDIAHCVGNVVLCMVLYRPLLFILRKMSRSGFMSR